MSDLPNVSDEAYHRFVAELKYRKKFTPAEREAHNRASRIAPIVVLAGLFTAWITYEFLRWITGAS